MTEDPPPITPVGTSVLISGDVLALMYRCTLALVQRRSRDGLAASPLLLEARRTLYRVCMSAQRHKGAAYHLAESRCNARAALRTRKLTDLLPAFGVCAGQRGLRLPVGRLTRHYPGDPGSRREDTHADTPRTVGGPS